MKIERSPIKTMIVKVVQRCNLNCTYCYMYNHVDKSYQSRPALMSESTFGQFLTRLLEYCENHQGHQVSIVFHGGEPMLMDPETFDRFATLARERLGLSLGGLLMQTNATRVTDEWVSLLQRHQVSVSVSVDGPPEIHDAVRIDHAGRGSHKCVIEGLNKLRSGGVFRGLLCVINPGYQGLDAYRYFRSLEVNDMNFLLPDGTHDSKAFRYGSYGPTPISDYLIPIFDAWFEEDDPEVRITLFEDTIRSILGGNSVSEAIGNNLADYLVIDTDGKVLSNDVFKVCEEGLAESGLDIFHNGFDDLHLGLPFFYKVVAEGFTAAKKCQNCPEFGVCGGGYLPNRYSRSNGFDNPSIWCEDLLAFIGHIRSRISNEITH